MEAGPIPEQVQEKVEQVDSADLVVGVIAELDQEGLAALCDALQMLPGSPRVVVLRDDRAADPGQSNVEAARSECFFMSAGSLAAIGVGHSGYASRRHVLRLSIGLCSQ